MNTSRRGFLGAGIASLAFISTAEAKPATVPPIWEGQKMWETFSQSSVGFTNPSSSETVRAYIAFDTQCPWCMVLHETLEPLYKDVRVKWCPIAWLGIHSEPQGALILSASDPWALFLAHHKNFKNEGLKGLKYDKAALPVEAREAVWTNTKLHRRCGCRVVPFGVVKTSDGRYLALDAHMTKDELTELFKL